MSLNDLRNMCHESSRNAGWWDELDEVTMFLPPALAKKVQMWFVASRIALIHSEVSEMMEGLRKGKPDEHLKDRPMEEVEAADVLIRLFDYAGARGLDLDAALREKMEYNQRRKDHKLAARKAAGGKKF